MGYTMGDGRHADTDEVTLLASAARTQDFDGSAVEVGDRGTLCLTLDVTAKAGTNSPTLDVSIETSEDGESDWRLLGSFSQKTAVGSERKSFVGADRFVRATGTIAGTNPSFTFSLSGEAK